MIGAERWPRIISGAFGVAALLAICSPAAFAADVPVRSPAGAEPAVAPIPVYNWTGWYVGATAGYGWTSEGIDYRVTSTFSACVGCAISGQSLIAALTAAIPPNLSYALPQISQSIVIPCPGGGCHPPLPMINFGAGANSVAIVKGNMHRREL